jgi:hypothetical protein
VPRSKRVLGVLLSAAVLAIAAPAATVAHEGNNSQTVIHACVNTSGVLKIVAYNAGKCVPPDKPLHWGIVGPAGPAGAVGAAGPAGPAGADGEDGAAGPAGADGENGAVGPAGPAGPIGPAGPAGPAGADGAVGPAGPAGADGEDGAVGPAGPAGADGAVGPAGPAGADGEDGAVGPAGPAGADGAVGPAGPAGPAGAAGANGVAGVQIVNTAVSQSSSTNEDVLVAAVATCPAGKVVIGGGGKIDTSNSAINSDVVMFRSYPATATTWHASAVITGGFSNRTVTVTSYAICATAGS